MCRLGIGACADRRRGACSPSEQPSTQVSRSGSRSGARLLDELEHAEQLADAADEQPLLLDVDPGAGREREDDVVAGRHRHLDPGLRPPVEPRPDREHDPVLGRRLVGAGGDQQARLADPVGLELLDHDAVEEWAQLLSHDAKG